MGEDVKNKMANKKTRVDLLNKHYKPLNNAQIVMSFASTTGGVLPKYILFIAGGRGFLIYRGINV